jgi:hypothetical protein
MTRLLALNQLPGEEFNNPIVNRLEPGLLGGVLLVGLNGLPHPHPVPSAESDLMATWRVNITSLTLDRGLGRFRVGNQAPR